MLNDTLPHHNDNGSPHTRAGEFKAIFAQFNAPEQVQDIAELDNQNRKALRKHGMRRLDDRLPIFTKGGENA